MNNPEQPSASHAQSDDGDSRPWWAHTGLWIVAFVAVVAGIATMLANSAASAAGACGGG